MDPVHTTNTMFEAALNVPAEAVWLRLLAPCSGVSSGDIVNDDNFAAVEVLAARRPFLHTAGP